MHAYNQHMLLHSQITQSHTVWIKTVCRRFLSYLHQIMKNFQNCDCLWEICAKLIVKYRSPKYNTTLPYARFLNRGVTLGLVNPRLVGSPWGKSRGNFCRSWNSGYPRFTPGFKNRALECSGKIIVKIGQFVKKSWRKRSGLLFWFTFK